MTDGVRWLSLPPWSGYGTAAAAYRAGLRAAGVPVTWTPLGWPSPVWEAPFGPLEAVPASAWSHPEPVNEPVDYDAIVVHAQPLWHASLPDEAAGRTLLAFTTWETDRLPLEWVELLGRYDRVLVPSQFNAEVFARSGVTVPLRVVPHIAPAPPSARGPRPAGDRFVVYVIGTWTTRKAIPDAVAAFLRAFTAADDVALVIHTTEEDLIAAARVTLEELPRSPHFGRTSLSLATLLGGHGSLPEITLSTRLLAPAEIDALHRHGDCFLLLSHGEGWGLGAFQAAAFGNPVVVTGWGGSLDFLPEGYPYCVDYELVPTLRAEADRWWYPRAGERWANASIDHAAELLRHLYEHREEAREWGRTLASHVRAEFGEERVTRMLLDALPV